MNGALKRVDRKKTSGVRTRQASSRAFGFRGVLLVLIAFSALVLVTPRLGKAEPCEDTPPNIRQYLSMRREFSEQPVLHPAAAAALVGALGLEWSTAPGRSSNCSRGPVTHGFFSDNERFCLLLWGCHIPDIGVSADRGCLIDSCGRVLWTQEVQIRQAPRVAQDGTVALIELGNSPEFLRARYIDSVGTDLGIWNADADSVPRCFRSFHAAIEFRPGSNDLVMLWCAPMISTDKQGSFDVGEQALRCLSSDGGERWRRDLSGSTCDEVLFSRDGSFVIARGRNVLHVVDMAGREVATFDEPGRLEIGFIITDSATQALYFFDGEVVALSLEDSRVTRKRAPDRIREISQDDSSPDRAFAQGLLGMLQDPVELDE